METKLADLGLISDSIHRLKVCSAVETQASKDRREKERIEAELERKRREEEARLREEMRRKRIAEITERRKFSVCWFGTFWCLLARGYGFMAIIVVMTSSS